VANDILLQSSNLDIQFQLAFDLRTLLPKAFIWFRIHQFSQQSLEPKIAESVYSSPKRQHQPALLISQNFQKHLHQNDVNMSIVFICCSSLSFKEVVVNKNCIESSLCMCVLIVFLNKLSTRHKEVECTYNECAGNIQEIHIWICTNRF